MTSETLVDQMINGHHYELIYQHAGLTWANPPCYYALKDYQCSDGDETGFLADISKPQIRELLVDVFNEDFEKETFFEQLTWRPF